MNPVKATEEQIAYWVERDGCEQVCRVVGGPPDEPDCLPCPALIGRDQVHVAFELDEIEVAHLARGGTLWLTTWGGLPVHLVEVVPKDGET